MARLTYSSDYRVSEYLEKLRPEVRRNVQRTVERLAPLLAASARSKVPKRSGRLATSITSDTYQTRTGVWGAVRADAAYAHFTEAGFKGWESVKTHYRTIKMAFGRPIQPVRATIRAHARAVDKKGAGFLAKTLAEAEPLIRRELSAAIDDALRAK